MSPHATPLRGSLPPEGADPAWGGPAPELSPHATPLRGSLPPEGADPAWGGPAPESSPHASRPTEGRPFKVLGVQQIAIGAPDKQRLHTLWVQLLGLPVTGHFRSERENVEEDICTIGHGAHAVEVDLMQPIDAQAKPAVHSTPLNHIGLWVDDLPRAVQWLTAQGVRFAPGGIRKGAAGHDICFLHPKASAEFPMAGEGVLIELVQAPPDVVAALA